jgi:hypothetical protein
LTEVFAVEMQQIKRIHNDAVRLPPHGGLKCTEVRSTVAILDNGLTINDCRFTGELGSGADDRGITVTPIVSIPLNTRT